MEGAIGHGGSGDHHFPTVFRQTSGNELDGQIGKGRLVITAEDEVGLFGVLGSFQRGHPQIFQDGGLGDLWVPAARLGEVGRDVKKGCMPAAVLHRRTLGHVAQ